MAGKKARKAFHIGGKIIAPGTDARINIETTQLYTNTPVHMPMHVYHGKEDGPTLLVCAAIHGDELTGIEVIRRLIKNPRMTDINGTIILVPIVNHLAFIHRSRYLPDRRDLNRFFPGLDTGSLASRIAHKFMTEVVEHATHIVDLHTAAVHRTNFPQIRTNIDNAENLELAKAFGLPMVLNAELIEGSLRYSAGQMGKCAITFEGGEALRLSEDAIKPAYQGVLNVMAHLGMFKDVEKPALLVPTIANSSLWVRADADGILKNEVELGAHVKQGQLLGTINDPMGDFETRITSPINGIVVGATTIPLVHQGEALYHIASFRKVSSVAQKIDDLRSFIERQE